MGVGFIGLGTMGRPIARHLRSAGHDLVVHSRTQATGDELVREGAQWVGTPAEVALGAEVVLTMVGGPDDVDAIYRGDGGLLDQASPGQVLIDLTTSSPELAAELATAASTRGVACLDAPVTGGVTGAGQGTLTLMVGGDDQALDRVRPLLMAFAGAIRHFGPPGAGQHAKLANQIAVSGIMTGLAEALAYAGRAGLDADAVLDTLGRGTARSFLLDAYGEAMLRGDLAVGFAVDHFVKDLTLAEASAQRLGLDAARLAAARRSYRELATRGFGRAGIQALIRRHDDAEPTR